MTLIDFSFDKTSNVLFIPNFENTAALRPIIEPLSVIVELALVLAKSMAHPLLEFSNIDILTCYQLPLSFIQVILEIANVLMDKVGQLAVPLLQPILELPLE